ncbi:MAG: hypothetical protein A2X94_07090 [Bdellovibrionales bacterium GWB1_55_8]|nr:MAG: hypothetical protein A2X94_07090 [Bdellovibrionales bacterium GWB1_55_8]
MNRTGIQKAFIRLALVLAAIVLPLYAYKVFGKTGYTDFLVYHRAATRALAGEWDAIYSLQDGASPFRYTPLALPFFLPFGLLSFQTAGVVWYLFQYSWFLAGFLFIRRALEAAGAPRSTSNWITAASSLFILRFCLDSFTIGQISSLMFLGFAAGLHAFMAGDTPRSAAWLSIPTLLKIGPGIQYLLLPLDGWKRAIRAWIVAVLLALGLFAMSAAWIAFAADTSAVSDLWKGWIHIVRSDSAYFDASHYGSQSLKSLLLRLAGAGWMDGAAANAVWLVTSVSGVFALLLLWAMRTPVTALGRGLFFSTGLFAYLWFMPETFKYSLTALGIPVALLFLSPRSKLTTFAIGFGFLTLSLAGKDLMPDTLFFGLQKASVPLFSTIILFIAVIRQAFNESRPAPWVLNTRGILGAPSAGPWLKEPEAPARSVSFILPLPLRALSDPATSLSYASRIAQDVRNSLTEINDLEILIVPYSETAADARMTGQIQFKANTVPPSAVILPTPQAWGRGAALRQGFLHSSGRTLLFAHFDQPCAPEFFRLALDRLASQPELDIVRANRRHPESRFRIPVRVLSLVYGRHRLGLTFNRLVRALLGIKTTDTHSGTLALTRRAAIAIFSQQSTNGFLFDLEVCLVTRAEELKETELPVTIHLSQEKPINRMIHETLSISFGMPALMRRKGLGLYRGSAVNFADLAVSADDWGMSPAVNAGILELAKRGVISRVSLMADARYLSFQLKDLLELPNVGLGIHFNLTYGKRYPTPFVLLLNWFLPGRKRRLQEYIRAEFRAQLEKLAAAGVRPVYLDGHHHVHVIPGLLNCIADDMKQVGIEGTRLPHDWKLCASSKFPLLILSWLSRGSFRSLGLEFSPFLYPLSGDFQDPPGLARKLARAIPGTEVITHPASWVDGDLFENPDDYVTGRVTEFLTFRQLAKFSTGTQQGGRS